MSQILFSDLLVLVAVIGGVLTVYQGSRIVLRSGNPFLYTFVGLLFAVLGAALIVFSVKYGPSSAQYNSTSAPQGPTSAPQGPTSAPQGPTSAQHGANSVQYSSSRDLHYTVNAYNREGKAPLGGDPQIAELDVSTAATSSGNRKIDKYGGGGSGTFGESGGVFACGKPGAHYGLVIDAGSSGSRLYIFCWMPFTNGSLWIKAAPGQDTESPWQAESKPGLSSYTSTPTIAKDSIKSLVEYALGKIGNDHQTISQTPLYLIATAGMRLLSGPSREEILQDIRQYLSSIPFKEASVEVISGEEEGLFGWLTANFLMGFLKHGSPFPTMGILDLGGASNQITFIPLDFPQHNRIRLQLGDRTYQIYSKSYLGLGQDQAITQVDSQACYPKGYQTSNGNEGLGDYLACKHAIIQMLQKPCNEAVKSCSLMGEYQPPVYGSFLAFSGFYHPMAFFNLGESYSLKKLEDSGLKYCSTEWDHILKEHPDIDKSILSRYCFYTAYIVSLLNNGYGFSMETQQINTTYYLQGNKLSWALGAMIYKLINNKQ